MDSLKGKNAIVTGGTRGIGRAIAERLLRDGAAVAICGRTQASVDRAVAGMQPLGRIFGVVADISQVEGARALFTAVDGEFGALDILVNNAGQGLFKKVGDMTPAEWHLNIDLNLNGAFYCAHEALPALPCAAADSSLTSPASPRATPSAEAPPITRQNLVLTVLPRH